MKSIFFCLSSPSRDRDDDLEDYLEAMGITLIDPVMCTKVGNRATVVYSNNKLSKIETNNKQKIIKVKKKINYMVSHLTDILIKKKYIHTCEQECKEN